MDAKLKRFLEVGKKETRVLGAVERHVISKPRDKSRRTDVLHPSEMCGNDWCHRASYFLLKGHQPSSNGVPSLQRWLVFEEGHDIHDKWQGLFQEMGSLYGKWYCIHCEEYFWGDPYCHDDGPLVYKEVPLFHEELRISGHADGILINHGDPLMLEIKSIGEGTLRFEAPELLIEHNNDFNKAWNDIKAPFMKHIMQAQLYMKLAELINLDIQPQEAIFIYEAKPNQKVKEFVVPKSDFGITHLLENAAMIVDAVKNNTPPECNIAAGGCAKCKGYTND